MMMSREISMMESSPMAKALCAMFLNRRVARAYGVGQPTNQLIGSTRPLLSSIPMARNYGNLSVSTADSEFYLIF